MENSDALARGNIEMFLKKSVILSSKQDLRAVKDKKTTISHGLHANYALSKGHWLCVMNKAEFSREKQLLVIDKQDYKALKEEKNEVV